MFLCSDNCKIGLYCDTNSTTCVQQKAVGASCDADKECLSCNCLPNQTCGVSPSNPHHLSTGIYAIIGIGIFGGNEPPIFFTLHFAYNDILGMTGMLVFLFFVHGRQRENDRQKRLQYWREQVMLIMSHVRGPRLTNIVTYRTLSAKTFCRCMKRPKLPYFYKEGVPGFLRTLAPRRKTLSLQCCNPSDIVITSQRMVHLKVRWTTST